MDDEQPEYKMTIDLDTITIGDREKAQKLADSHKITMGTALVLVRYLSEFPGTGVTKALADIFTWTDKDIEWLNLPTG